MTGYITIDHNKATVKADQSFDTCSTKYHRTPALYKRRWSVDTRELFRHIGTGLCSHCGFLQGWHFCAAQLLQWLFENQPLSVQTWTPSLGSTEEAARQTVGFCTLTQKCFFLFQYIQATGKETLPHFYFLTAFSEHLLFKGCNPAYKKPQKISRSTLTEKYLTTIWENRVLQKNNSPSLLSKKKSW